MEFDDLEASLRSPRSDLDEVEIEIELMSSQDDEQKSQQLNQKSQKKKGSGGQDLSRTSGTNKSGNKKKAGQKTGSSRQGKEAG